MSARPLVYLILGPAGSGRRALVADLIEGGLFDGASPVVSLAAAEKPSEADARLGAALMRRPASEDDALPTEPLPEGITHLFFLADGRANPVDQVEAFKDWLSEMPADLARILCVVDCRLVEKHPPLLHWFEACIHFSDVVLLNHREGVANKWLSDFLEHFRRQFFPCLFETVKQGRIANPPLVLEPQARRVSQAFDEPEPYADVEITDEDGDEDALEGEEDEDGTVSDEDPYLARGGGGRRLKEIPDITKYM